MTNDDGPLHRLLRRLELTPGGPNDRGTVIGSAGSRSVSVGTRIFGGLVVAQAIMAAGRVLAPRQIHSVQQIFLRPGQAHIPLHYRVEPLFEGRTFSSARVEVWQEDDMISHAMVGFSAGSEGEERRQPMEGIGPLDATVNRDEYRGRSDWQDQPVTCRIDPAQHDDPSPNYDLWLRAAGTAPDDPLIHRALLGYASDRAMISAAWKPHQDGGEHIGATLDHSIWFHDDLDFNKWHVHALRSPMLRDSRGMVFGSVYTQDGLLVASTAQQGMLRARRKA